MLILWLILTTLIDLGILFKPIVGENETIIAIRIGIFSIADSSGGNHRAIPPGITRSILLHPLVRSASYLWLIIPGSCYGGGVCGRGELNRRILKHGPAVPLYVFIKQGWICLLHWQHIVSNEMIS